MYSIVYFSPTGNVLHLAKKLAGFLGLEPMVLIPMEFVEPSQLEQKEHIVLMFPVHGFNAPRAVKRFVKKLPIGLFDKISLVAVGCARSWPNGAVTYEIRKILANKGCEIIVDGLLAMPLTFIVSFSDELSFQVIAESEKKIQQIANDISLCNVTPYKVLFKSHIMRFIGKIEQWASYSFGKELYANKNCVSCGICWENCPEQNIGQNKKNKPYFGFKCSMCLRCIYNCPQKAISPRVSKFIPLKNGYSIEKYLGNN